MDLQPGCRTAGFLVFVKPFLLFVREVESDEETSVPKADATSLFSGEGHQGDEGHEEMSSSPENIPMVEAIDAYKDPVVNAQAIKVLSVAA
ncbi:Lon protease homolog, mitochondrial [Echinococcus multilocularis]|uniref:Lon protease homolog, mitochondrial n=1 Tax=Echinococcus multilocularis TaxID=6211 RepID=A0A068Y457_ECHMU|nr:hypothetical protein EmuJ_000521400 [Echinococcus multilocularis]CUT99729.1 Lon protease homolog, mitochondrial [Echinococcus multilocularis]